MNREYGVSLDELLEFSENLLGRFENKLLGDTVARVGKDTQRKLSENDRLVGAAKLCLKHGISPANICAGIAAGLKFAPDGDDSSAEIVRDVKEKGILHALEAYCNIEKDSPLVPMICNTYERLDRGESMSQIISSLQHF